MMGDLLPASVLKVSIFSAIEVSPEQLAGLINIVETGFVVVFCFRFTWQKILWFINVPSCLSIVSGEHTAELPQKSGTVAFSKPNVFRPLVIIRELPALSLKLNVIKLEA